MTDVSTDWDEEIAQLNSQNLSVVGGRVVRAQHPKHHACVQARFRPLDGPEELRVGLFAAEGERDVLIRFSNGRRFDDRKRDAHGMAIKVLLADGASETAAQDFVLVDHETFFMGDVDDYGRLNAALLHRSLLRRVGAGLRLLLSPGLIIKAHRFASSRMNSPLETDYFSTTPYRLGDTLVKYVVRPVAPKHAGAAPGPAPAEKDADFLRHGLASRLTVGEAAFDLGVDIQTDPQRQPVEDPSVPWSTMPGARREWLARITVPQQDVAENDNLAENLVFSPWNTLAEHEPVGRINEIRRETYRRAAEQRHKRNGIAPPLSSGAPDRYLATPRAKGGEQSEA